MLQADLFDDFKGHALTLLVWGDSEGMRKLLDGLSRLAEGDEVAIGEGPRTLNVCLVQQAGQSFVEANGGLRWECSNDVIGITKELIEPLLTASGHQYVDVKGDAEQIMISANEYPANLQL